MKPLPLLLVAFLAVVSPTDVAGEGGASAAGSGVRVSGRASLSPRELPGRKERVPSDLRLLDRHGQLLHEIRVDRRFRRLGWTPLTEISPALIAAVLHSEDRRFRDHSGVDWRAIAAAIWQRLASGSVRGASTITMQLASLTDPHPSRGQRRSLADKWNQMQRAWEIEAQYSKDEILESYLNLVPFRGELQGVGAAAQLLFHKLPHGLSETESTVLAALIRAPNADRRAITRRTLPSCDLPSGANPESAAEPCSAAARADLDAAIDRVLAVPNGSGPRMRLAPHVASQLRGIAAEDGDLETTLDAGIQRFAREALRRNLVNLRGRNVSDGAVLVVDNRSGDVLAYVGSSGDLSAAPEVDGVRAARQAGSTLKPFLYAMALDERILTPASLLADTPLEVSLGNAVYRPENYDEQFRGLVPLRFALAGSLNVPAVRTLQLLGPDRMVERLRQLGMKSLVHSGEHYGLALALGSADVTLWDLVGAYRALANGGRFSPMRLLSSPPAIGASGATGTDTSEDPTRAGGGAISPEAAFLIGDILSDRESRSGTFGLENVLSTPFWTAVKTGTSKDMRDNWCAGYSRAFTVGVWVGNFSGAPMGNISGISGAAPLWLELMQYLHRDLPSLPPDPPSGIIRVPLAAASDRDSPTGERLEYFLRGTEPPTLLPPAPATQARIVAPAADTIFAIDPDIPLDQQVVLFAAEGVHDARWRIDGVTLETPRWQPQPGRHMLLLTNAAGQELDRIELVVRATARRPISPPP